MLCSEWLGGGDSPARAAAPPDAAALAAPPRGAAGVGSREVRRLGQRRRACLSAPAPPGVWPDPHGDRRPGQGSPRARRCDPTALLGPLGCQPQPTARLVAPGLDAPPRGSPRARPGDARGRWRHRPRPSRGDQRGPPPWPHAELGPSEPPQRPRRGAGHPGCGARRAPRADRQPVRQDGSVAPQAGRPWRRPALRGHPRAALAFRPGGPAPRRAATPPPERRRWPRLPPGGGRPAVAGDAAAPLGVFPHRVAADFPQGPERRALAAGPAEGIDLLPQLLQRC
jgi:hypothetical protein